MKCQNPRQLAIWNFLVRSTCLLVSGASLSFVRRVPIPLSFGFTSNSFSLGLLLERSASWRMTEIWGSRLTCSCRADHGPLHPPDTGLDKFFQVLATAPQLASWAPQQMLTGCLASLFSGASYAALFLLSVSFCTEVAPMGVLSLLLVCSHALTFWGLWGDNLFFVVSLPHGFWLSYSSLCQFMCVGL